VSEFNFKKELLQIIPSLCVEEYQRDGSDLYYFVKLTIMLEKPDLRGNVSKSILFGMGRTEDGAWKSAYNSLLKASVVPYD
jgi:hypothetical protein